MNLSLSRKFVVNDVWKVVKSMGPDKSSAVFGMSAMFYQKKL